MLSEMVMIIRRTIKGLGDAVMLEPLISIAAESAPGSLYLQLKDWIAPIYYNHPGVDKILREDEECPPGKIILDITSNDECPAGIYESRMSPKITKSRQQIFVEAAGFEYDGRPARLYEPDPVDVAGFSVGFQIRSAEYWRDYPYIGKLIKLIRKKTDWNIFCYDSEYAVKIKGVVSIVGQPIDVVKKWIAGMDLFIGPDSGLVHVAAALGVKTYAIFGPTDPVIRLSSYGNHVYWNEDFKYCNRSRCWYSPCKKIHCLSLLSPRRIYNDIKEIV